MSSNWRMVSEYGNFKYLGNSFGMGGGEEIILKYCGNGFEICQW